MTSISMQRIRRNISGQKQDANTRAIQINCFDIRRVKLVFILDSDENGQSMRSQRLPSLDNIEREGEGLGQKLSRLASLAVGGGEGGGGGGRSPRVGRRFLKAASDKVQSWRSHLPERVQGRLGGRGGGGGGDGGGTVHHSASEVSWHSLLKMSILYTLCLSLWCLSVCLSVRPSAHLFF